MTGHDVYFTRKSKGPLPTAMFFLLYGEDTFRSRKKLASMREQFSVKRDATGLNASHLRAREVSLEQIGEALFASPFLAERKLVVMEGFLSAPAAMQEGIVEMLKRKPETTNVIFYEDGGSDDYAKSALLPVLKAQKFTEECVKMGAAGLVGFVMEECAAAGVTIGQQEAAILVSVVGNDSWALHEEVAKLCAYAGAQGKTAVTREMLNTLIPGAREESIFTLVDLCVDGRCSEASSMLERMLDNGTSELQILAMLQKQYRTLIAVVDLVQRGDRDKNSVARRVGIHPYPASKAIASVHKYKLPVLRARYDELLEIERQIKTSAARPNVLLGVWLAKMAQAA